MSEILHIEGNRVDLMPNTINRTLQINDIGEAKDRQANYSNTIKLPKTPNNVQVFDYLGVTGNNSIKPYRRLDCDYWVNGIQLIRQGYAVVKASNDYYEVVIYDGIIDLAERIKGKKLNELSFADLNHYLSRTTHEESLSNTEGFIYAIGEFIERPFFQNIIINEQAPSVYIKTIWDKIFNEAGLIYEGDFFTANPDFQTEVLAPAKGYPVENTTLTSTDLGNATTNTVSRQVSGTNINLRYDDQHTFISGSYTGITTNPDGSLTITEDQNISIDINTTFSNVDTELILYVKRNGNNIAQLGLEEGQTNLISSLNITVQTGDVLTFVLTGFPYKTPYNIDYDASSVIGITKQVGGVFIDIRQSISELDQMVFIKDVMQRYGLILKPLKNRDAYEFIQFEELLNDRAGVEDWTDKLSDASSEDYRNSYAQVNEATYTYHEDVVEGSYDGSIVLDNDTLSPSKNFFSSPYQIPNKRVTTLNGQAIYKNTIWKEKDEDGVLVIENVKTPHKIYRINRLDSSINTKYFDEVNTNTITGLIPFLSLVNMEMQYFLNTNYKAFKNLMDRSKKVDASLLMNEMDIYNLDFFKLKYFKQTGQYYYLNNLKHTPGKLKKGELIQLNDFVENLPPTVLGVFSFSMTYENSRAITINDITNNTDPQYFDPEFDAPEAITITGGFNNDVLIKNGANIINTTTEILADNWNITIQDVGNVVPQHTANFTFKIKDKGSGQYSTVEGTIAATVLEYINTPPVAVAGNDKAVEISGAGYTTPLDGSASYDDTIISTYDWTIISKPASSLATITNTDNTTPTATLDLPNTTDSEGSYTIELLVTDEFGVTDTDTIIITATLAAIQPQ